MADVQGANDAIEAAKNLGFDVGEIRFDGIPMVKPTREEIIHALNPHWDHCNGCGGFHPVSSSC